MRRPTALMVFLLFCAPAAYAEIYFNPTFVDSAGETWTADRMAVVNQAMNDWTSAITTTSNQTIDVTFTFTNVTNGYLGQWSTSYSYSYGAEVRPWDTAGCSITQEIRFNSYWFSNPSGPDLWFDPTPTEDSDLTGSYWDALSVTRHELGHLLGFTDGTYVDNKGLASEITYWDDQINGSDIFDAGGLDVTMDPDLAHIDPSETDGKLMNPALYNGQRRDIDQLVTNMLTTAYPWYEANPVPAPATAGLLLLGCIGLAWRRRKKKAE